MDTYNNVVGNTISLLDSISLDERARRFKEDLKTHGVIKYLIFSMVKGNKYCRSYQRKTKDNFTLLRSNINIA